ncbi:hypothetical protein [Rickettsia endosymbiont of Gonocerus acuteangulatus]|uniref:hypothetical protein n=1 Tax=Rickettsia endosymbiont of Gonocerus acuteangulatus TaxID=3066266 RepID=UPI003132A3B5
MSLVSTGSEELRNFIDLEVAFYEEDFSIAEVAFNIYQTQQRSLILTYKNDNALYEQIIEFGKLKLKTLNISCIKYDVSTYINKLGQFYEFIECNSYFDNKLVKRFLKNKIHEYNTTEQLTPESFEEYEDYINLLG